MMITERQQDILKLIVEEYIKLPKPVSSNLVCKKLKCSSATIRNEMAVLEEIDLLEKTHTSSGRVPSEKGYRYYVDNLMELKKMNAEDMLKLQIIFKNQNLALSDCINKSLELISDMTNYTTVVLGKNSHNNLLKQIDVVPLDENGLVVIIITDKGHVQHKNVRLMDVSLDEVKKTVGLINNLISGTPIDEISTKLEYEIKPIIGKYVSQHEQIYKAFYQAFTDFNDQEVDIKGKNNIMSQFNDVGKIRDIYNKLDNKETLSKIETNDNDIKIYIGKENELDEDMSIIKTNYKTPYDEGTIAIIGPKRMEYDRVLNMLDFIKKNISEDSNE